MNPVPSQLTTDSSTVQSLLELSPSTVRLTACKKSSDENALIVRIHETQGLTTLASISIPTLTDCIELNLRPFEIKTLRIEHDGAVQEMDMIEETE